VPFFLLSGLLAWLTTLPHFHWRLDSGPLTRLLGRVDNAPWAFPTRAHFLPAHCPTGARCCGTGGGITAAPKLGGACHHRHLPAVLAGTVTFPHGQGWDISPLPSSTCLWRTPSSIMVRRAPPFFLTVDSTDRGTALGAGVDAQHNAAHLQGETTQRLAARARRWWPGPGTRRRVRQPTLLPCLGQWARCWALGVGAALLLRPLQQRHLQHLRLPAYCALTLPAGQTKLHARDLPAAELATPAYRYNAYRVFATPTLVLPFSLTRARQPAPPLPRLPPLLVGGLEPWRTDGAGAPLWFT